MQLGSTCIEYTCGKQNSAITLTLLVVLADILKRYGQQLFLLVYPKMRISFKTIKKLS
jgi:hypothetical protein